MAEYIDKTLLLSDIDAAVNNNGMGYVIGQTLKRYVKRQQSADVAPVVHGGGSRERMLLVLIAVLYATIATFTMIGQTERSGTTAPTAARVWIWR